MDGIIFYCYFVVIIKQIKKFSLWFFCCRVVTRPERRELRGPRTRNPFSTLGQFIPHPLPLTRHVPGWSTLGDQTGPVDIRGARPLHSGCCEAVLECASHAVDSRIFGSIPPLMKKEEKNKRFVCNFCVCAFFFVFLLFERQINPARGGIGCIAQR